MSQQKFIDREEEMEILKNQYDMEGIIKGQDTGMDTRRGN